MRRPALTATIYFAAGVWIGRHCPPPAGVAVGVAGCLFLVALVGFWRGWHQRRMGIFLGGALCALGAIRYSAVTEGLPQHHLVGLTGREGEVELWGAVADEPRWVGEDLRVVLRAEQVAVADTVFRVCGQALIRFRKIRPEVHYGDRLHLRLRLRRPRAPRKPGAFD